MKAYAGPRRAGASITRSFHRKDDCMQITCKCPRGPRRRQAGLGAELTGKGSEKRSRPSLRLRNRLPRHEASRESSRESSAHFRSGLGPFAPPQVHGVRRSRQTLCRVCRPIVDTDAPPSAPGILGGVPTDITAIAIMWVQRGHPVQSTPSVD